MKKHTLYFIIILLSAILLSGVASYFYLDGRTYPDGPSVALTQAQAKEAHQILAHLSPQDYSAKRNSLWTEINQLSTYFTFVSPISAGQQKQYKISVSLWFGAGKIPL